MAKTLYKFEADLKQLEALNKKLKDAEIALRKLKKGGTDSKKAIDGKNESVKKLNRNLDQTSAKARAVANSTQGLAKAGRNLRTVFISAGIAIASAFAVRAIAGGIRGMLNVFKEFESRMAAVKAISGATAEEFDKLEQSALKLGRTTVFSAAQIAKLQEEYARLGFTTEEIILAQEATVALAAATGEDLGNAAASAGSILRAFGYDASQTERVVNNMAASFTGSALNLERFSESMKFVAPIARNVGFTLEETTAMLMKLADAGLHGSIAGNALKNIFLKLGDANSDLTKHLGGPVRSLEDLVVKMKELKEGGFGATQAAELLEKRATPAFLTLIESADGLEKVANDLIFADGAAREMASIRLDTLEGDLVLMKSAMEGLGIALTDTFDLSLRQVVESFTQFLQNFAESEFALKTFRKTVIVLVGALAMLATGFTTYKLLVSSVRLLTIGLKTAKVALGAVFSTFSNILSGNIFKLTTYSAAARGATVSTNSLKAALASTPWGLLAVGVSYLVTSFTSLGDEVDEVNFKTERLMSNYEKQMDQTRNLVDGDKDLIKIKRELKDTHGELLDGIDIEIATKEELERIERVILNNTNANIDGYVNEIDAIRKNQKANEDRVGSLVQGMHTVFKEIQASEELTRIFQEFELFDWNKIYGTDGTVTTEAAVLEEEMVKLLDRLNNLGEGYAGEKSGPAGSFARKFFSAEFIDEEARNLQEQLLGYVQTFNELDKELSLGASEQGKQWDGYFEGKIFGADFDSKSVLYDIKLEYDDIEKGFVRIDSDAISSIINASEDNSKVLIEQVKSNILNAIKQYADVEDLIVGEMGTLERKLRQEYLDALDVFRKDSTKRKDQDEILADAQEELQILLFIQEMFQQMADVSPSQDLMDQAKADFLAGLNEENRLLVESYATRLGITEDGLKSDYGVRIQELQTYIANLQQNLKKQTITTKKIQSSAEKFRLEKTKDHYQELLKLQTDMIEDSLQNTEQGAKARIDIEEKNLHQELKMNRANITEIQKIRDDITSGKEAGEFINTKNIIKNYDVLQSFTKSTLKEFEKVYKSSKKKLRGQTQTVVAEMVTINEQGEEVITETALTLGDVLDLMIAEEQQKMATNFDYLTALYEEYQRNIAIATQEASDEQTATRLRNLELTLQQEIQANTRLTSELGGSNIYSRRRSLLQETYQEELRMIGENSQMKIKFINKDRQNLEDSLYKEYQAKLKNYLKEGRSAEDIANLVDQYEKDKLKLVEDAEKAKTKVHNDETNKRMGKEIEYADNVEQSIKDQIESYAAVYNQVFDMFSMLQTNALDMQMKRDQMYHENKTQLLQDQLDAELNQVGDNQEAQAALREVYADRQEVLDAQLEQKQQENAKKRFKMEKANSIVQAIINGALAMTKVAAETGPAVFVFSPLIAALTAAQVATISAQQFVGELGGIIPKLDKFAKGGMVYGPSHAQGGVKFNAGGRVVELEGGEAVINKRSTAMFRPQLSAMNEAGGGVKFAEGGVTPGTGNMLSSVSGGSNMEVFAQNIVAGINSKRVVVAEADITGSQQNVSVAEATSSLF